MRFSLFPLFSLLIFACVESGGGSAMAAEVSEDHSSLNATSPMEAQKDSLIPENADTAVLAGGCFWCLEAVFEKLDGVYEVTSGYSGGSKETADYKTVCSGKTNHAEAVQIIYDPGQISYEELLEVFWHVHDPTTLNRQGNDIGTQYRSAIFYLNEAQKEAAEKSMREVASEIWEDPIVTQIVPFEAFYPAEDYHQDYFERVGDGNPYCTYVISPKVQKFKKMFKGKLKE